jgi:hypothetical protein
METKTTTICPACQTETTECGCGLSTLVTKYAEAIQCQECHIVSNAIKAEEGLIYSHHVIWDDRRVIEQYHMGTLITTLGPYADGIGEGIFYQVISVMREEAVAVVGKTETELSSN